MKTEPKIIEKVTPKKPRKQMHKKPSFWAAIGAVASAAVAINYGASAETQVIQAAIKAVADLFGN